MSYFPIPFLYPSALLHLIAQVVALVIFWARNLKARVADRISSRAAV